MKYFLLVLISVATSIMSYAQDVRVREEAVRLLERGNAATTPVKLPDLERVDRFRSIQSSGSGSTVNEGTFTRVVIQGTGRRDEIVFGDYHQVDVIVNGGLSRMQTQGVAPAEVATLLKITPLYHISFNGEDVIHDIVNHEVNGRAARCIEFETIVGEKNRTNEVCLDAATGAIVLEQVNEEHIEYSDFFEFAGAQIPARIEYSSTAAASMEIQQSMTVLTETIPDVLVAPPGAQPWVNCRSFRRAFGQSMPQPTPGNGGTHVDVVVRGVISADGRIHDAVVQSSERPDLNAEALETIHKWIFTPPMCNNQPTSAGASFTLHFQGR